VHLEPRKIMDDDQRKCCLYGGGCVGCIGVLLIAILIPLSFQYVEWDQVALKKSSVGSKTSYTTTYATGRYFWGLGYTTVSFPKIYQFVEFTGASALPVKSNSVSLTLECSFQYRLDTTQIPKIFLSYGTSFASQVVNVARSALIIAAAPYQIDDYFLNRTYVSNGLAAALQVALEQVWAIVPQHKFQLRKITFPDQVTQKYLNAAISQQQAAEKQAQQLADVYRSDTNLLVSQLNGQENSVYYAANAKSQEILKSATASAFRIQQSAEGLGLNVLFSALNISALGEKQEFLRLYRSQQNNSSKGLYGISSASVLIN